MDNGNNAVMEPIKVGSLRQATFPDSAQEGRLRKNTLFDNIRKHTKVNGSLPR